MADTFAPRLRRRLKAFQAPRPIAQAWGVRSEVMIGLEADRLQTAHRASGQFPRLSVECLLRRPRATGRPYPRPGVAKSPGGFLDRRPGLPGKLSDQKLLFSGYAFFLTSAKEVGDAPEGRIQEDEPERRGEAG